MAKLESSFTRNDLETLIESMGDWESLGNHEFHLMNMVMGAPLPPEDHEAFEMMNNIKDHFRKRKQEIEATRGVRQEKATFLKAKLMLVRSDMGIEQLFDMSGSSDSSSFDAPPTKTESSKQEAPPTPDKPSEEATKVEVATPESTGVQKSLELAEFFIKDTGIWDFYQKFLNDRKEE